MAQDLLLKQEAAGSCFDIQIGEQDLETVDGLETTVAVLLFSDARAAPEEVNLISDRRGWVGNILRDTELGGMLWLWIQLKNTQEMQNKVKIWAENSLQPLIDEGLVSEIIVTVSQEGQSSIQLNIQIVVKTGEVQKFDYWLSTDLGNLVNAD